MLLKHILTYQTGIVGSTAGNDDNAVYLCEFFLDALEATEFGPSFGEDKTSAKRVFYHFRSFHDFLQHEVFVPALLRFLGTPLYLLWSAVHPAPFEFVDCVRLGRNDGNFAVLEEHYFLRVRQDW